MIEKLYLFMSLIDIDNFTHIRFPAPRRGFPTLMRVGTKEQYL
jgi:hypothetical protein